MALEKSLQTCLSTPQDQSMDIMRALVGVNSLEVHCVADHMILKRDAVAAVHVTRLSRNIKSFAAVVALHQRDHFWRGLGLVHQAAQPQRAVKPECDLGLHIRQLLLEELGLREWPLELMAVKTVLAR